MKSKRVHSYFLFALVAVLLSSSAPAQVRKLNVGYSAISAEQLPAWMAKETGIFKKTAWTFN